METKEQFMDRYQRKSKHLPDSPGGGDSTHWADECALWDRTDFSSRAVVGGRELIVVKTSERNGGNSWQWTMRGAVEPGEEDGADSWGWCETSTREGAELLALNALLKGL